MKKILPHLLVCALTLVSQSQSQNLNTAQGFIPGEPYQTNNIDNISLANGGVSVSIPIRSFRQPGGTSIDYSLQYDSKHLATGATSSNPLGAGMWSWNDNLIFTNGYTINNTPPYTGMTLINSQDYRYLGSVSGYENGTPPNVTFYLGVGGNRSIQTPDGSRHLVDYARTFDPSGYTLTVNPVQPCLSSTLVSCFPIYNGESELGQGIVTDTDGIQHTAWYQNQVLSDTGSPIALYQNHGFAPPMVQFDPSDHKPTSIVDSKGLTLPWADLNTGHVGTVIPDHSHCVGQNNIVSVIRLDLPGPGNNSVPYYICYVDIHIKTNFNSQYQRGTLSEANQDIYTIGSVTLPNNTSWLFEYQDRDPSDDPTINYGTLTKITFPTGGTIAYTYATAATCPQLIESDGTDRSRFLTKRVEDPGNGSLAVWLYNFVSGTGTLRSVGGNEYFDYTDSTMNIVSPDGSTESHSFAVNDNTCGGYEDGRKTYDPSGRLLLTVDSVSAPNSHSLSAYQSQAVPLTYSTVNTKTTLDDGSWFWHWYYYDTTTDPTLPKFSYGNIMEECVMDYNVSPIVNVNLPPASYLTYSYCSQNPTISHRINTFAYQNNSDIASSNMVRLISKITDYDSSNNMVAQKNLTYTPDSFGASQFSLSAISSWLNTNNSLITTNFQHDNHGQSTKITTPLLQATSLAYDSSGTYLTKVSYPSTSGISHEDDTVYDPNTDQVISAYDENGSVAASNSISRTYDPLVRLQSVTLPAIAAGVGGATVTYSDSASSPQISQSIKQSSSITINSTQSYDGFGRLSSTAQYDSLGAINQIFVRDFRGQVISESNPYRSQNDSSYGFTCIVYDTLGRVRAVDHISKGSCSQPVTTLSHTAYQYSGPFTDTYDGVGHHSRRQENANHQLIKLWEPDTSNNPSVETDYAYDALGNLTNVQQNGNPLLSDSPRIRRFTYDSLSRLTSSYNGETGTGSGACNGSSQAWSICYQYDLGGNLFAKTDARMLTTHYTYDVLNRPISISYSMASGSLDPYNTPSTCLLYDVGPYSSQYTKRRLVEEWTIAGPCGLEPLANNLHAITIKIIGQYDAVGNVVQGGSCTLQLCNQSLNFMTSASYDLVGNIDQYNGSQYSYDSLNRLQKIIQVPGSYQWYQPKPLYNVTSFGPLGPITIDLGSSLTKVLSYDGLKRLSSEITVKP